MEELNQKVVHIGDSLEPRKHSIVLSFTNLTYTVKLPWNFTTLTKPPAAKKKTILKGVSGEARDGEILAVLGASGSGKTTLLDALAGRIAKESLGGTVALNGEVLDSRLSKAIAAYVMQDDLLFPMLTVEETLMFAAEFRLPRALGAAGKKARVQALIDQLGLRNVAGTIIGDEGHRGISGGERRRVSIGTDIIHGPKVLFLDEPTSGLDSTSAFMVVKVLQWIARSGTVVVTSIHQPSNRIFSLLDHLLVLSLGQPVFSGSPADLPEFLSLIGRPLPETENGAEFALDLIMELEGSPNGTRALVKFNKKKTAFPKTPYLSLKELQMAPAFTNPPWDEIVALTRRSAMNSLRMPEKFGTRLGAVTVTGLILASMFWRLDYSPKGLQERLGFFAFAMSTVYYCCSDALPEFIQERYIFVRETAHNTYRRSSYVVSHSIAVVPSLAFYAIIFCVITFWSVGLGGSFPFYFLVILSSFWAGNSFVTFLSGVVPQLIIGYVIVVAILAYFFLFSGYFITRDRIPAYWIWFHYISLLKYPYDAVLQNEFSGHAKCFVSGTQVFDNTPFWAVPEAAKVRLLESFSLILGTEISTTTCLTTGADILQKQGVTVLGKWSCIWITLAWGIFYRILFYLSLLLGSKNKRR